MNQVKININKLIASCASPQREDLQALHDLIVTLAPNEKLWYFDGKNEQNKVVSNPNIGYGEMTIHYANGTSRPWFKVGISPNKTGISIYIMGKEDKAYLKNNFAKTIGKASVSGYCIKFKTLKDIHASVLKEVLLYGFR